MSVVTNTTTIGAIEAPSRRNTELLMLVFAVAISVFAYANVGLAINGSLPSGILGYGTGLALLAAVGHIVVRKFAPYADPLLLPLATLLNGIGLAIIWRLDQSPLLQQARHFAPAAPNQLMYSAVGVGLFVGVLLLLKDHRILQRYTYISMVVAMVLLIMPMFFPAVYGARIWVNIAGFTIQPGEFAKIAIAVFFSGYLMVKRDALALASRRFMGLYLPRGRDLGPILVIWAMSILILVFETDLGTSLLFFGLFVVMLYVATERTSWIVFGLVMSAVGAVGVASFEPHVQQRVNAWLAPFSKATMAQSDQVAKSLMSFGSGGTMGTGLGQGHSDLIGFAANSDFILATVGEELGLAGDHGHSGDLRTDRGARRTHRARRPRPLREAPRHRALRGLRHPGLRRGKRCHGSHPADRYDHAVHGAGRLVRNRQLGPDRHPDPDQRHRTTPGPDPRPVNRRRDDPGGPTVNKPLRRIAIFCGLLVVALLLRDNWLQYVEADSLNSRVENRRVEIERYAHQRGDIIVDGKAVTGSTVTKGSMYKYKRTWKDGPMWAPVTGYASQAFGATQLESLNDSILTGNDDRLFFDRTLSMFTGEKKQGGNVVTTLNADAQKAAYKGLGDKKGAVAALDPKTGAILAMASTPSYDPSTFAGNSTATDSKNYTKLKADKNEPLLNRALRQTYPPGSAFKVVTASAALENGLYDSVDTPTSPRCPGGCRSRARTCRTRATCPARTPLWWTPCGSPATRSSARSARTSVTTRCAPRRRSSASTASSSRPPAPTPVFSPRAWTRPRPHSPRSASSTPPPPRSRWPWWPRLSPTTAR